MAAGSVGGSRGDGLRVLVFLAGGVALAALLLSRRRRRPQATSAVERGACGPCGSSLYLDAAANALRCPRCDTRAASDGVEGIAALDDDGSAVRFVPRAFDDQALFEALRDEISWEQHDDQLPDGRVLLQPRLIAYQASDPSLVYSYEGLLAPLHPAPFTPIVAAVKARVEALTGEAYNSCHLNLYRTGGDHVSWHTDEDVPLYGPTPSIASVSFGATRAFVLRRMHGVPYAADWAPAAPARMVRYPLGGGALLVMGGHTQRHWEHCVLKESQPPARAPAGAPASAPGAPSREAGARINMTFRRVLV